MSRRGEQRKHPDDEEMVRDDGVDLRKANSLDAYAFDDLLVAKGVEQFAGDDLGSLRGFRSELVQGDIG